MPAGGVRAEVVANMLAVAEVEEQFGDVEARFADGLDQGRHTADGGIARRGSVLGKALNHNCGYLVAAVSMAGEEKFGGVCRYNTLKPNLLQLESAVMDPWEMAGIVDNLGVDWVSSRLHPVSGKATVGNFAYSIVVVGSEHWAGFAAHWSAVHKPRMYGMGLSPVVCMKAGKRSYCTDSVEDGRYQPEELRSSCNSSLPHFGPWALLLKSKGTYWTRTAAVAIYSLPNYAGCRCWTGDLPTYDHSNGQR